MQALYQETTGGPEAVRVAEVATPLPGAGEVRVAIRAASVNHREMWIARGLYPGMNLPTTMGCDGAGVVDILGDGVTGAAIGDEVVIYPGLDWGANRHAPQAAFGLLGMPHAGTIATRIIRSTEGRADTRGRRTGMHRCGRGRRRVRESMHRCPSRRHYASRTTRRGRP